MDVAPGDRLKGVNDHKEKAVYIIIFEGGGFVREKLQKLCSACSSDPV
jgi:hypothetical protein